MDYWLLCFGISVKCVVCIVFQRTSNIEMTQRIVADVSTIFCHHKSFSSLLKFCGDFVEILRMLLLVWFLKLVVMANAVMNTGMRK